MWLSACFWKVGKIKREDCIGSAGDGGGEDVSIFRMIRAKVERALVTLNLGLRECVEGSYPSAFCNSLSPSETFNLCSNDLIPDLRRPARSNQVSDVGCPHQEVTDRRLGENIRIQ